MSPKLSFALLYAFSARLMLALSSAFFSVLSALYFLSMSPPPNFPKVTAFNNLLPMLPSALFASPLVISPLLSWALTLAFSSFLVFLSSCNFSCLSNLAFLRFVAAVYNLFWAISSNFFNSSDWSTPFLIFLRASACTFSSAFFIQFTRSFISLVSLSPSSFTSSLSSFGITSLSLLIGSSSTGFKSTALTSSSFSRSELSRLGVVTSVFSDSSDSLNPS